MAEDTSFGVRHLDLPFQGCDADQEPSSLRALVALVEMGLLLYP